MGVLLSLQTTKTKNELLELGKQLAMHIAASSPLAIDKKDLDQNILQKEKEIITEQLKNTGKDPKIIDKIAAGKLNKFISENTLLNQEWIMDPKKKVIDVLKEAANKGKIEIIKFVRFKVGEGI
jgi:elongation factor Ts